MSSSGPVSPDPSNASGTSRATSSFTHNKTATSSYFDLDSSRKPQNHGDESSKNTKGKKPRWMNQVKDWLSTAEPSAQAMKEQRRSTFKKHGIAPDDPRAAAKLHVSMERVPAGATTSTSGPTPEKALKQRAANHRARSSLGGQGSQCGSSGSSLRPTSKDHRIAPWEASE
ncbi:hypothetical protein NLU13_9251 [Sarocladium strictum]|uniref:Uncharacterized protein n=1 Tax=Sarocladium strictum TaxID=5046 RepID=A0AA39GAW6_SARSR|nr:hypothetical protein NLU13_9251 [Sarocladium strictum]